MTANFWKSSHFNNWIFLDHTLNALHHNDYQLVNERDYLKIQIFFTNFIQALGEQLKVKQQVIATAIGYFKRFYVVNSLRDVDPFLLAPTSLFLASKVEEFGVISNTRLIATCQSLIKSPKFSGCINFISEYPYRPNNVLECEFYLLEMLDCSLIFYQPYRTLILLVADLGGPEDKILPIAWNIINDSLRTDLCLKSSPHLIAIACLHMASTILQGPKANAAVNWFAEINVDWDAIINITSEIMHIYEIWNEIDEKPQEIAEILNIIPKVKLLPSNSLNTNTSHLQNSNNNKIDN